MKAYFFILAVILLAACTKKQTSSIKVVTETVNELKVEYQFGLFPIGGYRIEF